LYCIVGHENAGPEDEGPSVRAFSGPAFSVHSLCVEWEVQLCPLVKN